jgi:peroxiredoxin
LPSLERLQQDFTGKNFAIVGIDLGESKNTVEKFIREHGISYDNLLDENGDISTLYRVRSTPMKYIIDADGNLVGAALGYRDWDDEGMRSLINILIKEG